MAMKDPQKESGKDELKQNPPINSSAGNPEGVDGTSEEINQENRIQDDTGTGLFDLGVAIGGTGGGVIGSDNPGRTRPSDGQFEEV
jgi:hypothetical protein